MSVHYDRIIRSMLNELEPGAPVKSADGQELGTLAEVRGEFIKVNAQLRPDYWLQADFVVGCEGGRVNMSFDRDDLEVYKTDEPAAPEDPTKIQEQDLAISEDEQIEQRMRMEAELAAQRQRLPHAHPSGEAAPRDTFGTFGEPVESELARLERERRSVPHPSLEGNAMQGPLPSFEERSLERARHTRSQAGGRTRWWLAGALLLGAGGAMWAWRRRAHAGG